MKRSTLRHASDARLRRWRARFDAMPSWVFLIASVRELRFAVEHEILAREITSIAADCGGYAGSWAAETWN